MRHLVKGRKLNRTASHRTYAKKDNLHGRRLIMKKIKGNSKKEISNILIHDIAPNYLDRNGGYTRIIKLDNRKNDNARMSLIEFIDLKLENDEENVPSSKESESEEITEK